MLKGSVKKGKQEPRDHHQTQHSPNSLALFATDSLLIQPSTNTQTHINAKYSGIKMVFLSNERRTIIDLQWEKVHLSGRANMQ